MKRIAALILLASLTTNAFAFDPFVVSDIRIDGLNRISAGTVYNYLPVNKGDRLTNEEAQRAIRALYQTKFFSDVEFDRDGNILVIKVVERPSIAKLSLRGNHDIKSDDLKKGLKEIGLAEGETFDRLSLDNVQQELIRQYYNRGKYNVSVIPHVTRLDRNRVAIDIEIREGKAAKIRELNILGNHAYTDKQIRKNFESNTPGLMSWYSKDDQYSREKLSGDLEKLQSYYMDRGYADFGVDSTQVAIAPDKRSMYIDASVKEGEVYKIADVKLLGKLILPEASLRQFVYVKPGQTFNRAAIEASTKAIKAILANIGYAYAKVTPIPKLDKKKRTVDLTLYIEPGQRVYVRRVVFQGNTRTEDGVLRREMRQLEGSWYSQAAIDRSKIRLQRLGFFKKVDIDKKLVAGTQDQVDISVKVEEQSAGSLQFGIGYSQLSGMILNASVSQNNLFGTGDSFSVSAQTSTFTKSVSLSYYNPYLTDNGIGIGYNLGYTKTDYGNISSLANFATSDKSFSSYLGIPISETDGLRVGMGISSNNVSLIPGYSPLQLVDYQNEIGNKTIHSVTGTLGWNHDTRNGYWAPTRGGLMSVSTDVALPGSTVQYWKLMAEANHYWPIGKGFVLYLDGQVGYGKAYGSNGISDAALSTLQANSTDHVVVDMRKDFPFWENFFSGGVRDVRGFQDNTLGPRTCINGSTPLSTG
ncbi:MAG TPA: outer membrane protein assembly factor BamA, partial [Rhodanobacter sp.]|nr:outer membrane protein assembly factor BamA [Rhodanobacter sp.]